MTEREQRDLARRLAEGSNVFDFEKALELVQWRPAEAEKLLRMREETERWRAESARGLERLHRAAQEFR